ncbi:hypothetical protein MNB_SM-7-1361 [hydrothermal vent metagenome]|uniref:Uncharacterized protein n=1 Tax=hydrothermal vent metagenome TaxID=652676 RepID=A0A1W1BYL1_9ZZZZ
MRTFLILTVTFLVLLSTPASANARFGKRFYMKNLAQECRRDGIEDGASFAKRYTQDEWDSLKEQNRLQKEWIDICPSASEKIKKMKRRDIKNLFDFVWKYAKDGEIPSCN